MEKLAYAYPSVMTMKPSAKEFQRVARKLVELEYGRYALGPIKKGERDLIIAPVQQEKKILDAIVRALKEKGAEVDIVKERKIMNWKTLPTFTAERSWDEFAFFPAWFGYRRFLEDSDAPRHMVEKEWDPFHRIREYIEKLPKKYDKVFAGPGGWSHYKTLIGGPYKSLWPYASYEYARLFADFPAEVWNLVEDKIKNLMPLVEEVRVRDEEGTDLSFTMNEEEATLWREESQPSNHLFMYPRPPSFPESNGVIAGTSNHFGFFPHVKVYMKHGLVERIEGGGKFGEMWRDYAEHYGKEQYPKFPAPGYYYIHESALATNPRGFRHTRELFNTPIFMTNDSERNRAGVLHWGFGLQALDFIERKRPLQDEFSQVMKFAKERGLPYCHSAHIHNYFLTYEVKLRNTKKWIKLVDKGRIALFEDQEVRKAAAKHGDPEKIFRYDWIPAIPGITYPGNYQKDYAKDPISWIRKEIKEIIPKSRPHLKEETGRSVPPHRHEPAHGHR